MLHYVYIGYYDNLFNRVILGYNVITRYNKLNNNVLQSHDSSFVEL